MTDRIQKNKITTIFWDYNGTLLNDTHLCIDAINSLLVKRNIPKLDLLRYRDIFTFPVKKYYERAGFDFSIEDFETPAIEFIELYNRELPNIRLFSEVKSILAFFNKRNFKQCIISAMKQDDLRRSVKQQGIAEYFDEIRGINDYYANGKTACAKSLVKKHNLNPANICLIGDTLHDEEVARSLGCNIILVANGHQSKERLEKSGRQVVDSLTQLKELF